MTKADLVARACEEIGPGITKKDAAMVADAFLDAIKKVLAEGKHIEIRGFGTFSTRERKPRLARNPRTGEQVPVDSRMNATFKPSRELRALVEKAGG